MARSGGSRSLRLIAPAAYVGGWVLFAALFTTQTYIGERTAGRHPKLFGVMEYHASEALFWGLATWLLHTTLRGSAARPTRERVLAWLGILSVVVLASSVWMGTVGWVLPGPGERGRLLQSISTALRTTFAYNVLLGVTLSAASLGVHAAVDAHRRALDAERAERALLGVRLELLTQQLQPHFLFNALNTIAGLTHSQPDTAEALIGHLSVLLRAALRASATPVVTVAEELDLLQHFQTIAMLRYGNRLSIEASIDPSATTATLPVLLLQPLLENAIDHGVGRRAGPASIWIRVGRHEERLRISIADDGVGLTAHDAPTEKHGVGLRNARLRLSMLYPNDFCLDLRAREGGGAVVVVDVPFRTGGTVSRERADEPHIAASVQMA